MKGKKRGKKKMDRVVAFIIFFSLFFSIYLLLNFYVIGRVMYLFDLKRNLWFYIGVILISLSFIITSTVERMIPNFVSRFFHIVSASYLGVLFIGFFVLILFEVLRFIIKLQNETWGAIIIAAIVLLSSFALINALFVRTNTIDVSLGVKDDVKIMQWSDVHLGTIKNGPFLKELVEKTNNIKPDVLVITGDLFDGTAPLTKGMLSPINEIEAPVLFVIGNHETYEGLDQITKMINDTNIKMLRNEMIEIEGIQFVGVDFSEDRKYLEKTLPSIKYDQSKPTILLYHHPAEMQYSSEQGIGLHLAGHTHKGQIFPFNLLVKTVYPKIAGLYDINGMKLYVSQGTNTWGPPMRLGSHSEITVINVKKER